MIDSTMTVIISTSFAACETYYVMKKTRRIFVILSLSARMKNRNEKNSRSLMPHNEQVSSDAFTMDFPMYGRSRRNQTRGYQLTLSRQRRIYTLRSMCF